MKNHSRNLHAPLCGRFHPNSVAVARYGALIRAKSPTNCDAHLAESLFQTRSSQIHINHKIYIIQRQYNCPKSISNYKQVNFHTVIHSSYSALNLHYIKSLLFCKYFVIIYFFTELNYNTVLLFSTPLIPLFSLLFAIHKLKVTVHSVTSNALRDAQKDEPSCDKHKK